MEKEERADVRKKILNEIKSNRPVLGINLRVAPEWGVICGYKDKGDSLFCRTKYDEEILEGAKYERGEHNPYDYLFVDNWPFILTFFGRETAPSTEKENLLHSLRIFVDCNAREKTADTAWAQRRMKHGEMICWMTHGMRVRVRNRLKGDCL